MSEKFRHILNTITQFFGALFLLTLNGNESISGAAYRLKDDGRGWAYKLINFIFFWQKDHCMEAALNEITDCQKLIEAYDFIVVEPHYADAVMEAVAEVDEEFEDEVEEHGLEEPTFEEQLDEDLEEWAEADEDEFLWVWDDDDYIDYISGPVDLGEKRKFYNDIKEWGMHPGAVPAMHIEEYRYWTERAISDATAWIAEFATPAPASMNGMTE